jgi:hypothetical protein
MNDRGKGERMRWSDMAEQQPTLEQRARDLIVKPGVNLIGTIRSDGMPRISPVEPLLMDGDLWLSMLHGSTKAKDLLRDPRILVHNIITNRDGAEGEFKIRGLAIEERDMDVHTRYADQVTAELDWTPVPGHFHLFRLEIDSIVYIRYEDGDQYLTTWPPGNEQVRRKLTPTSLHPPERTRQLLE